MIIGNLRIKGMPGECIGLFIRYNRLIISSKFVRGSNNFSKIDFNLINCLILVLKRFYNLIYH